LRQCADAANHHSKVNDLFSSSKGLEVIYLIMLPQIREQSPSHAIYFYHHQITYQLSNFFLFSGNYYLTPLSIKWRTYHHKGEEEGIRGVQKKEARSQLL